MSRLILVFALLLAACSRPSETPSESKAPSGEGAKITNFYAAPPEIELGQESLLCYSTENTPWVRLDPPVEQLAPSLSRCFSVKPGATTTYRLLVPGDEKSLEVKVVPAKAKGPAMREPKLIRLFVTDSRTAKPGQQITLCYGVLRAKSVRLEPGGRTLPAAERSCFTQAINATTTYKLTVTGTDGSTETDSLTVNVAN